MSRPANIKLRLEQELDRPELTQEQRIRLLEKLADLDGARLARDAVTRRQRVKNKKAKKKTARVVHKVEEPEPSVDWQKLI